MTTLARAAAARFDQTLTAGLAGVPGTVADSLTALDRAQARSRQLTGAGSPGPGWRRAEDDSWVRPGFYPEDRGGAGSQTVTFDQLVEVLSQAQRSSLEDLAEVLNRAELTAKGPDLVLIVNNGNRRNERRGRNPL